MGYGNGQRKILFHIAVLPASAAVAICPVRGDHSLVDILHRAKKGLSLEELGIVDFRMRHTANGSLLIEITGSDGSIKADILAGRLRGLLRADLVISRPSIKDDFRFVGLDEITTPAEIREAVPGRNDIPDEDIKMDSVGMAKVLCGSSIHWLWLIKFSRMTD